MKSKLRQVCGQILCFWTEVSLSEGSVLRYCRGSGICERDVMLDGEGYFKVAKNEEIPFFVKIPKISLVKSIIAIKFDEEL